jgi:hypothetical protein
MEGMCDEQAMVSLFGRSYFAQPDAARYTAYFVCLGRLCLEPTSTRYMAFACDKVSKPI